MVSGGVSDVAIDSRQSASETFLVPSCSVLSPRASISMGAQISFCQGSGACGGERSASTLGERSLSLDEKLAALARDVVSEGHIMRNGSVLTAGGGLQTVS